MVNGIHYENQTLLLKAEISKMLSLVLQLYKMAVQSIEDADERLAKRVLDLDDPIDDLNRKIEETVYEIIARFNPMAKDLRYVITMIKFANNLERIADLAHNIAKKTLAIKGIHEKYDPPKEMKEMIGISIDMTKDAFTAFGDRNLNLVKEIFIRDKQVDRLEEELYVKMNELNKTEKLNSETIILYTLMARDVERISDHVKNLCSEIYYIETGNELKPVIKQMKQEKNGNEEKG
ncbi:MAG TPA: phosphate signaling complex protein PhoU [Thermotogota bacterium]|nr:phosphate signaling complex protein PhoU [Thermotogota bacterium]